MPLRRKLTPILAVLFFVSTALAQDVSKLLASGDQFFQKNKFEDALKEYEKVNKAQGDSCSPCQVKIAFVKIRMGDEAGAVKAASKAFALAKGLAERADANAVRGEALMSFANGDKKKLASAEEAFRDALKDDVANPVFKLKVGIVLLKQEKDEEGKAALKSYLATSPDEATAATVRRWIDDPRRVRLSFAPDFTVTTLQGQTLKLSELAGKVVIVDFWASWCGPCRRTVPEIKELISKYGDKLVVISISADRDEAKWKGYVAEKNMTWHQYRDADEHVLKAYNIQSFPTLFLVDQEGIIRGRINDFNERMSVVGHFKEPLTKMLK
jgi:thiol-disulfide isomerase/thioredoxin